LPWGDVAIDAAMVAVDEIGGGRWGLCMKGDAGQGADQQEQRR